MKIPTLLLRAAGLAALMVTSISVTVAAQPAATVAQRIVIVRDSNGVTRVITIDDASTVLEHTYALRRISDEFARVITQEPRTGAAASGTSRAVPGSSPDAIRSLQRRASDAVVFIRSICRDSTRLRKPYVGLELVEWQPGNAAVGFVAGAPHYPRVERVESSSPAQRAGVMAGDTIVALNGNDMRGRTLGEFIPAPGTTVTLELKRGTVSRKASLAVAERETEVARTCDFALNAVDLPMLYHRDSLVSIRFRIDPMRASFDTSVQSIRASPQTRGRGGVTTVFQFDDAGARGGAAATGSGSTGSVVMSGVMRSGPAPFSASFFGARYLALDRTTRQDGTAQTGSVFVVQVQPNSAAARAGLRVGDIISRIAGKPVSNLTEMRDAVQSLTSTSSFSVEVIRDQKSLQLKLSLQDGER